MKILELILILIWSIVWFVNCVPRRKINETIRKFNRRTGDSIAVDNLILKYEREHNEFHKRKTKDGNILEWPYLNNKNLSHYCRKYLQHSVPGRKTGDTIGMKFESTLHYEKENTSIVHIIVVRCTVTLNNTYLLAYYMTRTPEPHCVYALKAVGHWRKYTFSIIHKHCDFENKPLLNVNKPSKWKKTEIVDMVHRSTGQPIAKGQYLLQYELEHQELHKKEGEKGKSLCWPFAMESDNLDSYCYQYMRKCVPNRNQEGIIGSWKTEKIHYQKLNTTEDTEMTTISCLPSNVIKRWYYMTRAPETNCVYALLQMNRGKNVYMVIIFKHCDFEDPNYQQITTQENNNIVENVIPKNEVKEEIFDSIETLHFFK